MCLPERECQEFRVWGGVDVVAFVRRVWSSQDLVDPPPAGFMSRFELLGTQPSEMAVTSRSIVEGIDVVSEVGNGELAR